MTPSGRRLRAVGISVARTSGVAWLTLVALMLVMANEVAIPLDFLARPMLVAVLPAFVIGVASTALGRFATLAAVVVSPLVLIPCCGRLPLGCWRLRSASGSFSAGATLETFQSAASRS